ncbi:integrase/recombinase xerD homolog [Littorina saxatilis]|uniref:integrase/recombinase xerD homolog n=1 Tax=Littorina saxatilis TaxID=31220 RepID=UPI0038B544A5
MSGRGRPRRATQGKRPARLQEELPRPREAGNKRQRRTGAAAASSHVPSSDSDSQGAWFEGAEHASRQEPQQQQVPTIQGPMPGRRHSTGRDPQSLAAATSAEVKRLVSAAFAPATQAAYKQGIRMFEEFRFSHGLGSDWPASPQQVVGFAAHLSLAGKAHTTARTYIAGIGAKHKLNGWSDPADNFLLKKLLQGMTKLDRRQDLRKPITLQRLKQLIGILPVVCANVFEEKLFTAAYSVAFFGFLRVSEVVGQGDTLKGARAGIGYADVVMGKNLKIRIRGSKTDQAMRGEQVCMRRAERHPEACPVLAMQAYLQVRPSGSGPLFKHFDGAPLSRYQFQAILKRGAKALGWEVNRFTSHSFRIGAATTAAMNGTPVRRIMALGRWESQAVEKYVRTNQV